MAIAFDAIGGGGNVNPGTSLSFSHTCTGSDRYVFVGVKAGLSADGDLITGVTYDSVSMTLLEKRSPDVPAASGNSGNRWIYLYGLAAPSTGAQTVVVSASSSVFISAGTTSYTGVDQTTPIEASGNDAVANIASSLTMTITVGVSNAWTHAVMGWYIVSTYLAAGTDTTARNNDTTFATWTSFDSGGPLAVGSHSLQGITTSLQTTTGINGCIVSMAPAGGGGPAEILMGQAMM